MNTLDSLISTLANHIALSSIIMSYALVVVAEIGDKSQLMCMMLAARYRALPVALGAIASFILLNGLAVLVGASIKELIEPQWISLAVAVLFISFGLHSFFHASEQEEQSIEQHSAPRLFITTFMLITVAEFGDKTQLAVIALGSSDIPFSVFVGATLALITTTALGIWAGQRLLSKISLSLVAKVSGFFFIVLGLAAAGKGYNLITA